MNARLFALLLILLGGCAGEGVCNLDESETVSVAAYIINGEPSLDPRQTVAVGFRCSGTVVGPNKVVTASHCNITEGDTVRYEAKVGEGWRDHTVVAVVTHPSADLQVAYVKQPINLGAHAPALIGVPNGCFPGLVAQGYGKTESREPGALHERVVYETNRPRKGGRIYTTEGNCYGDSGGPLYARVPDSDELRLIGVASKVRKTDCTSGVRYASVYVDLTGHLGQWVRDLSQPTEGTP